MKKWFLAAIVLGPALAFALGLRIDFKLLMDAIQKKPDHNAEALKKMGIDPNQVEFKTRSWWTMNPEDNLFRKIDLAKLDPVKKMSDETWEASQTMKKNLGPSPGEGLQSSAQLLALQARRNIEKAQKEMAEGVQ